LRFTLTLSFPTDKQTVNDVQATLWAWDTFGGIGARTRRGFGALACEQVSARNGDQQFPTQGWQWEYQAANRQQVEQQLFRDGGHFVAKGSWAANVPHLSRSTAHYKVVVLNNNPDEYSVWKHLIKALKDFRQERDANFGRSHWPEPDAIRARTGQSLPAHRIPKHASPLNTKFPRAAFGLPIIFEFQNGAPDAGTVGQDPRKTTLSGAGVTRLASPLILRPLACGNGQYVGLALVLEGTHLPVLQLKDNAGVVLGSTPIADLDATDAANLSNKHTDYDRNTTDVLQAFLKTLK
jgi:CRISPR-associated protein Cmr1